MEHTIALRRVWPLVVEDNTPTKILRFIHPLKQEAVATLIEHTERLFPDVRMIAAFGSAVKGNCTQESDVDIVVVGGAKFYTPATDVYDIVRVAGMSASSPIVQSILKEGVVIYGS